MKIRREIHRLLVLNNNSRTQRFVLQKKFFFTIFLAQGKFVDWVTTTSRELCLNISQQFNVITSESETKRGEEINTAPTILPKQSVQ